MNGRRFGALASLQFAVFAGSVRVAVAQDNLLVARARARIDLDRLRRELDGGDR